MEQHRNQEVPGEQRAVGPVVRLHGSEVFVGTCSWTDTTLVKSAAWYPKKTMTAGERLAFYAARFPVVEADSTYYRPLSPELAAGWADRSPDGFRMDIKAYSLLTGHPTKRDTLWPDLQAELSEDARGKANVYGHHLPPDALEEVWDRFLTALAPLREVGRLGAVLLQYPPWFTPKRANREELARVAERLGGVRACVEFRSPRWLAPEDRDRTLGLLAELGLAFVVVDAPEVSGLETVLAVTGGLAVVRFHGRADDTWKARTTTAAERFKYLYDKRELRPWVTHIAQLAREADEVHALMNNCYQDYGVRNAADLQELLAAARDE